LGSNLRVLSPLGGWFVHAFAIPGPDGGFRFLAWVFCRIVFWAVGRSFGVCGRPYRNGSR